MEQYFLKTDKNIKLKKLIGCKFLPRVLTLFSTKVKKNLNTQKKQKKQQHYFTFIKICRILTSAPVEIDGNYDYEKLKRNEQND